MSDSEFSSGGETSRRPRGRLTLMTVFLGIFMAGGLLATGAVVIDWLQGLQTHFWEQTTCTIERSEVIDRSQYGDYDLQLAYRYYHRGEEYQGTEYRHAYSGFDDVSEAQRAAARYAVGSTTPCWVDPDAPASAYLAKANLWRGFLIFLPLLFVAIPGGVLWAVYGLHRKTDPETQARTATAGEKAKPVKTGLMIGGFFGIFFLVGAGLLIPFFIWPTLQVVKARSWIETDCVIESSGVASHPGDDSTTYSVEALYNYEIDGKRYRSNRYQFMSGSSSGYEGKAEKAAEIPAGATATCYVDPEDPFSAVIHRGFTTDYLFGLIPALFAAIGLGGMIFARSTFSSARKEAAKPSWSGGALGAFGGPTMTTVPAELIDTGPLELEPSTGRLGKLGCATAIALFWNGIVSVFVWQLVESWRSGGFDWFLALFLTPFVLIGLLLLSGIPYSILALANPRPSLRLSRRAIPAGESAQIDWSFRGAGGRIRRLKISLASSKTTTERVVHSRGASINRSSEPLDEIEILDRGEGRSLAYGSVSFNLPADAPPTSQGDEAISWVLKLHGEIAYWPDVMEEYEIRVLPFTGHKA